MRSVAIGWACGLGVLLGTAPASRAQSQGDVGTMSCADFVKTETAGGFTQGVTGKPAIDTLSAADTAKVRDYCASHPGDNAGEAIRKVQAK